MAQDENRRYYANAMEAHIKKDIRDSPKSNDTKVPAIELCMFLSCPDSEGTILVFLKGHALPKQQLDYGRSVSQDRDVWHTTFDHSLLKATSIYPGKVYWSTNASYVALVPYFSAKRRKVVVPGIT